MLSQDKNLTLSEWLNQMLSKRGLENADGRHIYQYRISDDEFADLEEFLRNYIAIGQSYLGFAWLAKRPAFPVLFVLYGAEWWRRRYDGSVLPGKEFCAILGRNPPNGHKRKEANASATVCITGN